MTDSDASLVREALAQYGLGTAQAQLLRHNENLTYRIDADAGRYVLRIRKPVPGFSLSTMDADATPLALAQSEAALLAHLSQRSELAVQTPRPTLAGTLTCVLSGGYSACLLSWLDGVTPDKAQWETMAGDLGEMAARLHRACEGFGGARYRYSHRLISNLQTELTAAHERAHLSAGQLAVCLSALAAIDRIMTRLDGEPRSTALLHADLSPGNVVLMDGGTLAPIDFSLSGYGYRAQECGMLATQFRSRSACEELRLSYERVSGCRIRPEEQDAFAALSVLLFAAAQHNRFAGEAWFQTSLDAWCSGCFVSDHWGA